MAAYHFMQLKLVILKQGYTEEAKMKEAGTFLGSLCLFFFLKFTRPPKKGSRVNTCKYQTVCLGLRTF